MTADYSTRIAKAKQHLQNSKINSSNKTHINKFVDRLSGEGIKPVRQLKYLYTLKTLSEMIGKDFSACSKDDIVAVLAKINNSPYENWTKRDFMVVLKRFFRWLREEEGQMFDRAQYPREVSWITTGKKIDNKKLPKQLLTIDDVQLLAAAALNLRDKCFVLVLYDSGARIGEILNIKLKDIEFDKFGAKIMLSGKTGERRIRVLASAPAISNWLLAHPDRDNPESTLFCGVWSKKRGEEIGYQTFRMILTDLKKKTGLKKPVNPHQFRHSRATELAQSFTEAQLCEYFGWVQGSQEAATYVHLCGRDMDNAVLKLNGIEDEEKKESQFRQIACPRCKTKNSPGSKFCSNCSLGLDVKTMMDYEQAKDDLIKGGISIFNDDGTMKKDAEQIILQLLRLLRQKENKTGC